MDPLIRGYMLQSLPSAFRRKLYSQYQRNLIFPGKSTVIYYSSLMETAQKQTRDHLALLKNK
jgi:hypothetical protein